MADRISVSSADFIRSIGFWQNEALRHPIHITHHGRPRLVLAASDGFEQHPLEGAAAAAAQDLAALRGAYGAVLDHLSDGLIGLDAQFRIATINRVAIAFCGGEAESLRGALLLDVMPQPLASILVDRAQRVGRARKSEELEVSAFDGRHLAVRLFPLPDGVGILFHNMTEVASLRRRLEEGDALASSLAKHSQAVAIKLDARARIECIDGAFCALSGFASTDLAGHRFVDLVNPQQRREVGELIERTLRETTCGEIALTLLGRRGDEHPGLLSTAPIMTDFVAHGIMAVWTPISDDETLESAA